jgi:hypothetical protein
MKAALDKWFFSYVKYLARDTSFEKGTPVDIMFCLADHFEPGWGRASIETQRDRLRYWLNNYPRLSSQFSDNDGYNPQHTWFFPPHEADEHLVGLVDICKGGFGEIELHFHHDHIPPVPDTAKTLEVKIIASIERYAKYGVFGIDKISGKRRFGFIHGDWALDNSMGGRYCGVNSELQILSKTGCYADFTFPSICESQPKN